MAPPTHEPTEQQDAKVLAAGYGRSIRLIEWCSIAAWVVGVGFVLFRLYRPALSFPWAVLVAGFLGFLAADLISGCVHWLADTWGSPDVPLVGKALIRPFREHHADPKAITRHDFVETNGNNCLASLPAAGLALLANLDAPSAGDVLWATFWLSVMVWVLATNQFHKWAHDDDPPRLIRALQGVGLVLSPSHHDGHHGAPYNRNYCITVGWMNYPLQWFRVFQRLEGFVTKVTGALPRRDDLGARAASFAPEADAPAPSLRPALPVAAAPAPVPVGTAPTGRD